MSNTRIMEIRRRLEAAFDPEFCEVSDESHLHIGHAGARDGRGHFSIHIKTLQLNGLSRIAQHRLIYEALGDLLQTDIHAVRIEVLDGE